MTFEAALDAQTLHDEQLVADPATRPKVWALAINWDAADDNAEVWWQAFYECKAAGTAPVELHMLEDREISEPMTRARMRVVAKWVTELPGWDVFNKAVKQIEVKPCALCRGLGFAMQHGDSDEPEEEVRRPGRYERCDDCNGNGVVEV